MQKRHVKLLLLAVFISILIALPNQVSAHETSFTPVTLRDDYWNEQLEIEVVEATYLDYDDDGQDDDILTVFRILVPEDWESGEIYVRCVLEKPSGDSLFINFDFRTKRGAEITLVWFNSADESGWYTLFIEAEVTQSNLEDNNNRVGPAYIEHEFDPPGGSDKHPPLIAIIAIEEL